MRAAIVPENIQYGVPFDTNNRWAKCVYESGAALAESMYQYLDTSQK